jgi:hypothetical protein
VRGGGVIIELVSDKFETLAVVLAICTWTLYVLSQCINLVYTLLISGVWLSMVGFIGSQMKSRDTRNYYLPYYYKYFPSCVVSLNCLQRLIPLSRRDNSPNLSRHKLGELSQCAHRTSGARGICPPPPYIIDHTRCTWAHSCLMG